MHWIDWIFVVIPLLIVVIVSIRTQKYIRDVADFMSAGRVAGRYVIAVAGDMATSGLISLVMYFEIYYNSGLAYNFWNVLIIPITAITMLTGYCTYRYRETRAMTMGQFLGMRYGRWFRIYAGTLQAISGVLNYAIFPAVSARFLVYFCDLPLVLSIGGWQIPTFMIIMAIFLSVAVFVATRGGQITIMISDCISGIMSYPIFIILIVYLFCKFSWFDDVIPALLHRPAGKSLLNPFDIQEVRDFNLFFVIVGIFAGILNTMAWSGTQGYNSAAKNAHEQKIGMVLSRWRTFVFTMAIALLAIYAFTYLNSNRYAKEAALCRSELASKVMADVSKSIETGDVREQFNKYIVSGEQTPVLERYISLAEQKAARHAADIRTSEQRWGLSTGQPETAVDPKMQQSNPEIVKDVGAKALQGYGEATGRAVSSQNFDTIFGQMRVPMALRAILPIGITGAFCAFCVFLLLATDTAYLHSWGGVIVQDVILPLRNKPFTPQQHLKLLRFLIACVALFAFLFSAFFAQIDFILMFFTITGMIWLGGAGACIVGGLYWKRGTTAGAFTALTVGSGLAFTGIILQKTWETRGYPWLESHELVGQVAIWLEKLSSPFNPYIKWEMSPTKFPINSQEIFFLAMLLSVLGYIIVSLLTCKQPYNLDRMLHRGKYRQEGEEVIQEKLTLRVAFRKLVGITSEYTRSDKVLAFSVFFYYFIWLFGSFLVTVVWNKISPWPIDWWGYWYLISAVYVPIGIIVITAIWFSIGGIRDLRRLFVDLKTRDTNILDDGRTIGNISAGDSSLVQQAGQKDHPIKMN